MLYLICYDACMVRQARISHRVLTADRVYVLYLDDRHAAVDLEECFGVDLITPTFCMLKPFVWVKIVTLKINL